MPGPLGECISTRERLAWPDGVTTFAPRSDTCVEPTNLASEQGQWYRRNLSGFQNWMSGHILADLAESLLEIAIVRPDDPFQVGPGLQAAIVPRDDLAVRSPLLVGWGVTRFNRWYGHGSIGLRAASSAT